jgi:hypothetical protein
MEGKLLEGKLLEGRDFRRAVQIEFESRNRASETLKGNTTFMSILEDLQLQEERNPEMWSHPEQEPLNYSIRIPVTDCFLN